MREHFLERVGVDRVGVVGEEPLMRARALTRTHRNTYTRTHSGVCD